MDAVCENRLVESFNLMWGKYPEPAQLIHRSFKILAVNQACQRYGGQAGVICCADNGGKPHPGCKALRALRTNTAQVAAQKLEGMPITGYWIPVGEAADYYVHFGNGVNQYIDEKTADLKGKEMSPSDNQL